MHFFDFQRHLHLGASVSKSEAAQWDNESIFSFRKEASVEPGADDSGKRPVAGHGVARPVAVAASGGDAWPVGGSPQHAGYDTPCNK